MRTFEEIEILRNKKDKTAYEKALKEDFNEMADVVEKFMQKYCNPHTTIIAKLDGIEWVQGEIAKSFEVLD